MIVEAIVNMLVGLFVFMAHLLPSVSVPGWVGSIASAVGTVVGFMAPLNSWVPFNSAGQAVLLALAAAGIALLIRGVRMVISFFTGGGGA